MKLSELRDICQVHFHRLGFQLAAWCTHPSRILINWALQLHASGFLRTNLNPLCNAVLDMPHLWMRAFQILELESPEIQVKNLEHRTQRICLPILHRAQFLLLSNKSISPYHQQQGKEALIVFSLTFKEEMDQVTVRGGAHHVRTKPHSDRLSCIVCRDGTSQRCVILCEDYK